VCIGLGVYPEPLYQLLPYPVDYEAYKASKVLFYLQLLLFSGLAFFLLLPWMQRTLTITLDVDWLWRRGLPLAWRAGCRLADAAFAAFGRVRAGLSARVGNPLGWLLSPIGLLGRSWEIGTTALWVAVLLAVYVAVYLL